MPTANLTDRKVASLKSEDRLVEWWDEKTPGFGIRVSPKGKKTWFVMYRIAEARPRLRLGHYPGKSLEKARREAKEALVAVSNGKNPARERQARIAELKRERLEART